MTRRIIAEALSGIEDIWIYEAVMYAPGSRTGAGRKRFRLLLIAAILGISIFATGIASGLFPEGIRFSELHPFSGYHSWSDNYSYKKIISQQAIVLDDIALKDNYTFEYSSREKTGDQNYMDLEWKPNDTVKLKKGDIVDVVYYGDTYSTICLSIRGHYHELEDGKTRIPYGILKSDLLSFDPEKIAKGNQAQLNAPLDNIADEDGCFVMEMYDSPNGNLASKKFTKDVTVLLRKNGWAKVQSWSSEEQTGWCPEDRLSLPVSGWTIYNPTRCIEDDVLGDGENIRRYMEDYLKGQRQENTIDNLFQTSPNAFLSELINMEETDQDEIITALSEAIQRNENKTDLAILDLAEASALDEIKNKTIRRIMAEIKV